MKKFALKSAVLAISALASLSAVAATVDLDAAVTATKFASEMDVDGTTGLALTALDANNTLAFVTKLGVSTVAQFFVRVDLTNGSKFVADPATVVVTAGGAATLSSGGAGATYAVYSIAANAGNTAAKDLTITLAASGVKVFNKNATGIRVRLYETLTTAQNPDAASSLALKDTSARNYITFTPGLTATLTPAALVADVSAANSSAYTKFTPVVSAGSALGSVAFAATASTYKALSTQVAIDDVLLDTSDLTYTGDFSFVKGASEAYADAAVLARVFLHSLAACTGGTSIAPTAVTATSASFDNIAAASLATHHLCVKPVGTVSIPAGSYNVAINYEPKTGYTKDDLGATAIGSISRNGTTLVAPLTNQPAGWSSRLVLTNSGGSDRTYAVTAINEDGSTVTLTGDALSGTVLANRTKIIDLSTLVSIVPAPNSGSRTGLQVVVNGPATQISGQYQLVNGATGNLSNVVMVLK